MNELDLFAGDDRDSGAGTHGNGRETQEVVRKCGTDGLRELALFAGAGGGILGGHLLGWETVCAVENDPYAASVLVARQNDGCLPSFPIWDDVRTFDGRPWRGIVDVVSGGFPCQDISAAGKGAGIEGERSGLWGEFARIIREVRPRFAFVENSPMLTSRGLYRVLGDLAEIWYDAEWGVLGADDVGGVCMRKRIWIVAKPDSIRRRGRGVVSDFDRKERARRNEAKRCKNRHSPKTFQEDGTIPGQWVSEPATNGMDNGVACQLDRLRCTGNGQVPLVAAVAWTQLRRRLDE